MRGLTIIATLFLTVTLTFGQDIKNCGLDNQALISEPEAQFLNDFLKDRRDDFDFTDKKILFITGNSGHIISTKPDYFDSIRNRLDTDLFPVPSHLTLLTEEEKKATGYDAILTYWVKRFTKRSKRKALKYLQEQKTD